jgi:hypothetical protein
MAAAVCRTLSRLAGIAANVITFKKREWLHQLQIPTARRWSKPQFISLLRPLGGERRTLE